MGRRPIPTHLKLLRGNPGKQKLPNEPRPEQLPELPDPPPHISGYAADEWWSIGRALYRLGLLTEIDNAALACYCHSYGQWRMAAESLARMQNNDPLMNGMIIKTKYGDAAANPLVAIVRKHAGDVVRFAAEFGLTPAARSRINAGVQAENPQSKFAGLLAG